MAVDATNTTKSLVGNRLIYNNSICLPPSKRVKFLSNKFTDTKKFRTAAAAEKMQRSSLDGGTGMPPVQCENEE